MKYWDKTLSLVEGCTPCGARCLNCWSAAQTHMRSSQANVKILQRYHGMTSKNADGRHSPRFNGQIRLMCDDIEKPLKVRKPATWAVWNDLYHPDVPDEFRDRVYRMADACDRHAFLVLTGRPGRMADYLRGCSPHFVRNVRHGISAATQAELDAGMPHLLRVPGYRWLSLEPLLGPIDLSGAFQVCCGQGAQIGEFEWSCCGRPVGVDAVIVGGESGPNARPCNVEWIRDIVRQCVAAGVSVMCKQLGSHAVRKCGTLVTERREYTSDRSGADPDEWPEDLQPFAAPIDWIKA